MHVRFDYNAIPSWLRDDVVRYLAEPVTRFGGPMDADAYATFAKRLFGEMEVFLASGASVEDQIRIATIVANQPQERSLALSQSSDAREAEQLRARFVRNTLGLLGYAT
jgi:hypothetical protein